MGRCYQQKTDQKQREGVSETPKEANGKLELTWHDVVERRGKRHHSQCQPETQRREEEGKGAAPGARTPTGTPIPVPSVSKATLDKGLTSLGLSF